jgi:hypothetical protein
MKNRNKKENHTVLCGATERGPPTRSQLRRHLNYGVCAGALPPQAGKVLSEVVVEVVSGGRVGDEDCKGRAFEFTAIELLEPGGQDLAASKGDETFDDSMPLGLCSRIWSAKFFGCGLLRTTGGVSVLYRRIRILLDGNLVLGHHFLVRWARRLGRSARCRGKA